MNRNPRVLFMLCAGLLSACGVRSADEEGLRRIDLPGFSIEVLDGKVTSTSASPSDGKHVIKLPEPSFLEVVLYKAHDVGTISIDWSSQALSHEDWKTTLLPTYVQTFDAAISRGNKVMKEGTAGENRWVYVIGTPRVPLGIGVVNCDTTFSVTVTFARYRDVERQFAELSRIVKSIQCSVTDANRARPFAATRLPGKFGKTPDREVQLYQALDGEQVAINFTQSDVQRDPTLYRKVIRALLVNATGIELPDSQLEILPDGSPRPAGKSSLMRANYPESNEVLYVGTQYCPDIGLSMISLWIAPEPTDQLARERQSQIGCPGEESSASPSFASIADAACAAGEKQFCGLVELKL